MAPTSRACDCCRTRKIKCDGELPCKRCKGAQLPCTYDMVARPRGPKRTRDSVLNSLRARKLQRDTSHKADPDPIRCLNDETNKLSTDSQAQASHSCNITHSSSGSPGSVSDSSSQSPPDPCWNQFSRPLLSMLIGKYFANAYFIIPVLDYNTIMSYLDEDQPTYTQYCLVTSMCAFVAFIEWHENIPQDVGQQLHSESIRSHRLAYFVHNVSVDAIMADYFLFVHGAQEKACTRSWFYLREAITLAQLMGMDSEPYYWTLSEQDIFTQKLVFFTLFVTERGHYLSTKTPLTLEYSITLPELGSRDPAIFSGFFRLVEIFSLVNDYKFLLDSKSRTLAHNMLAKLESITASISTAMDSDPADLKNKICAVQHADVMMTKYWLRMLIWQAIKSSTADSLLVDDWSSKSLMQVPFDTANEIITFCKQFPIGALELHGMGMADKVSDILDGLCDILSDQTGPPRRNELLPRFFQLLDWFQDLHVGKTKIFQKYAGIRPWQLIGDPLSTISRGPFKLRPKGPRMIELDQYDSRNSKDRISESLESPGSPYYEFFSPNSFWPADWVEATENS